jgi:hypothetical protein
MRARFRENDPVQICNPKPAAQGDLTSGCLWNVVDPGGQRGFTSHGVPVTVITQLDMNQKETKLCGATQTITVDWPEEARIRFP